VRTNPSFRSDRASVNHGISPFLLVKSAAGTTRCGMLCSEAQRDIFCTALSVDASSTRTTKPGRGCALHNESRHAIASSA